MRRHCSRAAVAVLLSSVPCTMQSSMQHAFLPEGPSLDLDGARLQLSEADPRQRIVSVPSSITTQQAPRGKLDDQPLMAPGLINSFDPQPDRPSAERRRPTPLGGASLLSRPRAADRSAGPSIEQPSGTVSICTRRMILIASSCLAVASVAWAVLWLVSWAQSIARRAFSRDSKPDTSTSEATPAAQPKKQPNTKHNAGLVNVSPRLACAARQLQCTTPSAEPLAASKQLHARAATNLPARKWKTQQRQQSRCSSEPWSDSSLQRLDSDGSSRAARRAEHFRQAEEGRIRREGKARAKAAQHTGNEVAQGSWYCGACTYQNPPQRSCSMCGGRVKMSCLGEGGVGKGSSVDGAESEENEWVCRCCSASNEPRAGKCTACGSAKYATHNRRKAAAIPEHLSVILEDWICGHCQLVNPGIHGRCVGCSAGKYVRSSAPEPCTEDCVDAASIMMSRPRTEESALRHLIELRQRPELGTLLLGDSMFERLNRAGRASWHELQRRVDGGVFNGGVGGDRIEHALWRVCETPLLEEMPLLRRVVVCLGSNNLMQGQEVPHMLTAIRAVLETILKRGVSAVLLGLLPIQPLEQLEQSRAAFNIGLKQLAAARPNVIFVDLGEQFTRQELFADDVHLNEKGYKLFANGVVKAANDFL